LEKKILNVGAGTQTYGTHFVDLYPQRDGVIKCDVDNESLPFENDFFDEVYSNNIFEHLKNPNSVLVEMFRVLKPGGKFILYTDNSAFWGFHVPFAKCHYGDHEKSNEGAENRHYALYTPWHLMNHLRGVGIKDSKFEYLLPKERNPYIIVRIISRIIGFFYKRIGYSIIKVTATKAN